MLKKVIGLVLVLCALAAAVHFIPWPRFYDHTLKGVELEYSIEGEITTLYAEPISEVTVELDIVQKHYLLSHMVIGGEIQMGTRNLKAMDVNRFDKATMNNAYFPPFENVNDEIFGTEFWDITDGGSIRFLNMHSNYDMERVILQDWQNNKIYLLSTEPFDLEETISYFEKYGVYFFDDVVR